MSRTSLLLAAGIAALFCAGAAAEMSQQLPPNAVAARFDPYKNFKFRLKWDGRYIAGVSHVSPLVRHTEVVNYRAGGDPSASLKSPGRTEYEAVTLERGLTHDPAFENWADSVLGYGATPGQQTAPANFRKDVTLEIYNEVGQLVFAYQLKRCWPSEYQALPDLDAGSNAVLLQHIKLECESWDRDRSVGTGP